MKNLPKNFERDSYIIHDHIMKTIVELFGGPNEGQVVCTSMPYEKPYKTRVLWKRHDGTESLVWLYEWNTLVDAISKITRSSMSSDWKPVIAK